MAKQTVAVKLDPNVLARVDALAHRLSARRREATRSDALRAAILLGIGQLEAEVASSGAAPAPVVGPAGWEEGVSAPTAR